MNYGQNGHVHGHNSNVAYGNDYTSLTPANYATGHHHQATSLPEVEGSSGSIPIVGRLLIRGNLSATMAKEKTE